MRRAIMLALVTALVMPASGNLALAAGAGGASGGRRRRIRKWIDYGCCWIRQDGDTENRNRRQGRLRNWRRRSDKRGR
jgi:hypothetical protein